ncbi:MAG TPA: putative hydroxymethylpyrimidine transporter CytX [Bacillota bacterium]|nr:putative hydroxymethylpyrimidine transporter CytX [Bacillota bacterium]
MENEKTSTFSHGLLWFGAAVSLAEIMTGTLIAPLGLRQGISAILVGHLIGCILFYLAGLIGAKTGRSAMETVKLSFGQKGSLLFSSLNILQLTGWTAIMILSGAKAAGMIFYSESSWIWSILICGLIVLWLLIGVKNLNRLNTIAMAGLFGLSVLLSVLVFKGPAAVIMPSSISFGAAVELSAAMPLSWLPLVSDYTCGAKKPKIAAFVSAFVYFLTSSWMYLIGMCAAIFTGESDITVIMIKAGFGLAGLLIVIFSTVTTTFLDVFSAGMSAFSISKRCSTKWISITVCLIGTILAIFIPVTQFENFLYLIGSVFAPMIAIQVADTLILKHDSSGQSFNRKNLILWAIGFFIYRYFMSFGTPLGNTLPVMLIVVGLCVITNKFMGGKQDVR